MPLRLSRRDLLEKCAAAGLLIATPAWKAIELAPLFAEGDRAPRLPTPENDLGPFYKKDAPMTTKLAPSGGAGLPLEVSGKIYDTRGNVVPLALIELWHASPAGEYDNVGFRYRGELEASESGQYAFESVMPGHYPGRLCQHVHYKVSAPGHRTLVTQLYFATDPAFEGDPAKNYTKDPIVRRPELIRPVVIGGEPSAPKALVKFEIVLARA